MSNIRIQSWATRADQPGQTTLVAAVCIPVKSIIKTEFYELTISGQYSSITAEMLAAVEAALVEAGVMQPTQPANNEP